MPEHKAPRDAKDVLERVRTDNIKVVNIWFSDILGTLKSFAISTEELHAALEKGVNFDGSSIEGFTRMDETDMLAWPDPTTFVTLPWRPKEKAIGRMFADIRLPDDTPFEGDPRYVLKRNLERMKRNGFSHFYVGPELEYFYFKSPTNPEPLDKDGYFDAMPSGDAFDLRRDTVLAVEALGIPVEYAHHEVAWSQHEIDLRYQDALPMADSVMTLRLAVKEIARSHGLYATFMPKPLDGLNGSGMHTHLSLFTDNKNAFFDAQDKWHISDTCKKFIAGLMKHAPEICMVTNPLVNSYKRLIPGYEAPIYVTWALRNRADMIRVPSHKAGQEKATRIEFRSPDPSVNPYLAFSAMLASGLEGIEKGYKLPPPAQENAYNLTAAQRAEMGIHELPGSLIEAIHRAEKSEALRRCLGDHVSTSLVESKKIEWDRFRKQVTKFELDTYLPVV